MILLTIVILHYVCLICYVNGYCGQSVLKVSLTNHETSLVTCGPCQCSICRGRGWGFNLHWLRMTPLLVTVKFGLVIFHSRISGNRSASFPAKTGTVQLMALLSFTIVAACSRDAPLPLQRLIDESLLDAVTLQLNGVF